jgi:O-antigen/teichoic acid export membrane protein
MGLVREISEISVRGCGIFQDVHGKTSVPWTAGKKRYKDRGDKKRMRKNILRKYFTDSFFLNAPLGINTAISLITLPVALAHLPIDQYGKWQFVVATQVWLSSFTAGNITAASKRGIAQGLTGTFLHAFFARLKLLVPACIVTLTVAAYLNFSGKEVFSYLFIIIGGYLVSGYLFQRSFSEFLVARKSFRTLGIWQILISSVSMTGSALAAVLTNSIFYYALFQMGSISILSFAAWISLVKKEKLVKSYKGGAIDKECTRYGLRMIPVDLSSVTSGRISHFIIGAFWGFSHLAVFSVAIKLRNKSVSVIKSVRPLLYADFVKLERRELLQIINRHLMRVLFLGILLTAAFLAAGWFYISFFLPAAFHNAIHYFAILSLGLPAGILSMVLHTILESHLRYKELTVVGIIPDFLRIILILVFGYIWHITGVCIALAAGGLISFGFYYLLTIRKDMAINILDKFPFLRRMRHERS